MKEIFLNALVGVGFAGVLLTFLWRAKWRSLPPSIKTTLCMVGYVSALWLLSNLPAWAYFVIVGTPFVTGMWLLIYWSFFGGRRIPPFFDKTWNDRHGPKP